MSNGSIIYEGRLAFMEIFTEEGTKAIRMPSADLPIPGGEEAGDEHA